MSAPGAMQYVRHDHPVACVNHDGLSPGLTASFALCPVLCSPHRVARHMWRVYCYALATSPLATQSLTAAVGFASGDACAQVGLHHCTNFGRGQLLL